MCIRKLYTTMPCFSEALNQRSSQFRAPRVYRIKNRRFPEIKYNSTESFFHRSSVCIFLSIFKQQYQYSNLCQTPEWSDFLPFFMSMKHVRTIWFRGSQIVWPSESWPNESYWSTVNNRKNWELAVRLSDSGGLNCPWGRASYILRCESENDLLQKSELWN